MGGGCLHWFSLELLSPPIKLHITFTGSNSKFVGAWHTLIMLHVCNTPTITDVHRGNCPNHNFGVKKDIMKNTSFPDLPPPSCFFFSVAAQNSLVPRPRPAFHRLQYEKAVEAF